MSPLATRQARAGANQRQKRRAEVLDAAAKVFNTRGYAAASVQEIADELGILKGSLYHYMTSKEDLLYTLLRGTHDELWAIMQEAADLTQDEPLRRLWFYVYRQVEYNINNLPRISIYYRDTMMLGDTHRHAIMAQRHQHEDFVIGLIGEATGLGEQESTVAAMNLFATIIWTHRWYRDGKFDTRQLPTWCANFAVHGIAGQASLDPWPTIESFRSAGTEPPAHE